MCKNYSLSRMINVENIVDTQWSMTKDTQWETYEFRMNCKYWFSWLVACIVRAQNEAICLHSICRAFDETIHSFKTNKKICKCICKSVRIYSLFSVCSLLFIFISFFFLLALVEKISCDWNCNRPIFVIIYMQHIPTSRSACILPATQKRSSECIHFNRRTSALCVRCT